MKTTFTLSYVIAFLSMVFLMQELHDWAHVLTAGWLCGCNGPKGFDSWALCNHCDVSGKILAMAWFAGPALTFSFAWIARAMMAKKNSDAVRSTGFSLLFAANPFVNIVASFSGGGDIAYAMKMVFESPNGSNRHFVSIISLLIVLLLAIPPIIRAFQLLKSKRERLIIIPAFLILPNFMKLLVVSTGMNFLLKEGFFQEEVISGAPLLVLIWLFVLVFLLMINYKSVLNFIKRKEWYGSIRV